MTEEHRINIMEDRQPGTAPEQTDEKSTKVAGIGERFVALLIDWGLVSFLYQLLLVIVVRALDPDLTALYLLLVSVIIPFVLYETVWSSGGRSTLGKKLVGIRVADKDSGEPLGIGRAFVRSVGYIFSTVLLMCGFLLAFIDDRHRALQDYMAGSVVVQARQKSWFETAVLSAVGFLLIACFIGIFYKQFFGAGSWAQQRLVYRAQQHIENIAHLEDLHMVHFGYYTNDLLRLSLLSGDPVQFQRDTHKALDNKGFRIGVGPKGYKIMAHAKDNKKTPVYFPNN